MDDIIIQKPEKLRNNMTGFISEQGAQKIRNFKYKGGSISISYIHLWSPLAQALVKIVPMNVAPNVITLVGTIIHIIGNLSLVCQTQKQNVQPWTLLFFGFCVFLYYNIDNVDGKQARRTNNSSPLGMCMDHSCDILGVSFIALGVARVIGFYDQTTLLITSQIGVLGCFWASIWSQYYSKGILVLGKVNAVDDGIPFIAFLGVFTYIVGQQFWLRQIVGGFTISNFFVVFIWVAGILQIVGFVLHSGDNFTSDLKQAFSDLIHFPFLSISLILVISLTNWSQQYLFPVYFTTALVIVRDTSYMNLCVVAEQKYNQWQVSTIGYIVGYSSLSLITYFLNPSAFIQSIFVYGMLLFVTSSYLRFVIGASNQMADILGIKIFSINTEKLKKNN